MTTQLARPQSFREFWDYYVSQHLNRTNRRCHFVGTTIGFGWLVLAIAWRQPWFILAGLASGYAGAWFGHFVFEKNKPATWGSPLFAVWSFGSDWIMWAKMLTGRMDREVTRVGALARNDSSGVAQAMA
ncbi:MAG: DUF962 domain-containing protein [Myxococcales bacterium]|nr:DUF962 domain-containing protein [Myxococcales bacterium]